MDSLHALGFYASSGISLAGGIGVALLPTRRQRGQGLGVAGIGLAGIFVSLSAGFAAAIALVCYFGAAWLIASPGYRSMPGPSVTSLWRQVGAVGAAGLLAILAYSAFRGDFAHATFYGGAFDAAAIGRLIFEHDAIAAEAVAVLGLVALVGATAAWRTRERGR
ncbi:MAG TPA: NADH-quinone oxidoreductase subunit J [Gemmatimonadales bacterium]|nr:NADH-quinone oxidoreductase subunit J [Gemmatimonadales bacterium]